MPQLPVGALVMDTRSGYTGILTDVLSFVDPAAKPDQRHPRATAFVRPPEGGVELRFRPDDLVVLHSECAHPRLEKREDGTYCTVCKSKIYLPA
ncbi:hypothetical protein [Streptomyces sulphureus]|uniref:hypothetical protein n=1 Tax=Streptomyces sulphureus TaxID=47758 RepID=UPI0003678158|nr:hypothetical protein [Streptomyces sulphureus]